MLLSKEQVNRFFFMWGQACRTQGWTAGKGFSAVQINVKRKEFLARFGFSSLTLVTKKDGFTKVKNELIILISNGTNIKAAQEAEDPLLNKARNFRWVIRNEILPCLGVYEDNPLGYMRKVMADKNRWWKLDRPESEITLEDLDAKPTTRFKDGELQEFPSTLEQLMMTLNARVHDKRREAGHSIRDMKALAGLATVRTAEPEPVPAGHREEVPDENVPF